MKLALEEKGYHVIEGIYTSEEVDHILSLVKANGLGNQFGERAFLSRYPEIQETVFTKNLLAIIQNISPACSKSIKSIYFDKPPNANWLVNWHQDLTINLENKKDVENFVNWRSTKDRITVQPDRGILESIFTIRIHLDDCTQENGALRVIGASNKRGVIDIKNWISENNGKERICEVKKGGILLMKPLTLHASRRTENRTHRRVIHIEFTDRTLPDGLKWKEEIQFNKKAISNYTTAP